MAAKPPKPPGNFLKSLLNQHNNNKNQQQFQQQQSNEDDDNKEGNSSVTPITSTIAANTAESNTITPIATTSTKTICNCSNISIMHLFHEMKQEFPTLPDTIVAQCVNENCHQRENCIQMLKHELELNPIPAQSYPAKVLHPPNNNNLQTTTIQNSSTTTGTTAAQKPPLQQKPLLVQQKPPLKPIKPTRTAPLQPPLQQQTNGNTNSTNINSTLIKNTNKSLCGENITNNDEVCGRRAGGLVESKITQQLKQSICANAANSTTSEVGNIDNKHCAGIGDENIENSLPRQRPTTLNLNTQLQKQQQQQRQRLNIQLQQRFQEQRNRQQSHQPQNPTAITTKPLRKAPLPPIAPKPAQLHLNHNNTNNFLNDSLHTTTSPLSESEISVSVSLSTPSPTSSSSSNTTTHHPFNRTTQPQTHTQTPTKNQQHLQTKSPIRHRSVINLQPEPPYTRDFLFTPASLPHTSSTTSSSPSLAAPAYVTATGKPATATNSSSSATSSPTTSVTGSQKSFTSVNLTLRPPVSPNGPNSALQPSTIDITAGPGFSGASGGGKSLHYSSTSYDARLGYQQNFQITVTDECGVFTASRIRPQQQQQTRCLNQQQFHNNNVVALQQNIQNSIQSPQGANTSSGFGSGGSVGGTSGHKSGNMCLPPQQAMDAPTQEVLQRQKKKRDKLAAALREYKKRLGNVEQEINLLTGTIPTEGLSERLDEEIIKLRRDCQDMLRSSNTFVQPPLQQELAINHQPQQQMYQQQQPPQPFPRQQRIIRPPQRPPPPRQTSLDIIQHHSQTSSPHTPPAASLPNLNLYSSLQLQQLQQQNHTADYYHQQSAPLNTNFVNNNELYTTDHSNFDEQDLVEEDAEDYDEYEEVVEQPWECNMCTFRNHPQLNICETCENVRIIPGRLTNLSRALSTSNYTNSEANDSNVSPALGLLRGSGSNNAINNSNSSSRNGLNTTNGNLEHDTNLVQQQLQHFALHT